MSPDEGTRERPRPLVVLAGGRGSRLGRDKAWVEVGGAPLLARILARLAGLADGPPIVVGRPGQTLPHGEYRRVDDRLVDAGPLAGLAAGLAAVEPGGPRVAVAACDYPFAEPDLFRALARLAPDAAVAVPRHAGRVHWLHGLWRADLAEACASRLAAGERRVRSVAGGAAILDAAGLAAGLDPGRALLNVNVPADLARARSAAGRDGG